ncbi:MAG: phage virion morphogenesis protein, partial [Phycisphaerales bacterium]|nr:phage virion morphogenesis protein [Phycisphaerales bacterium]
MATDCAPIQERIGELLREGLDRNFQNRATAAGSPWPPLSEKYIKRVGPHPILELTGAMRAATTTQTGGHISNRPDGMTVEEGINPDAFPDDEGAHWAGVHDAGSLDGRIPQRAFVEVDGEIVDQIVDVVADYVAQTFTGGA